MTQWGGNIYPVIIFMTSHGTIHEKINHDEKEEGVCSLSENTQVSVMSYILMPLS